MTPQRNSPPQADAGQTRPVDELGAHVSTAGGVENAPARAAEIDAVVLQLFTKQPSRWAEPNLGPERIAAFREARKTYGIRVAVSHDSYLINLAAPDATLFERSYAAFRAELERCEALGLEYLVTHPGNATDGDEERGIRQNAQAIGRALMEVPGSTVVLLETTAGSGHVLGATFEQIARLLEEVPAAVRDRVAVCVDTCHLWAAGYDIRSDYYGVFGELDRVVGLDRVRLFHLNDSVGGFGSRRDRHADIGEGTLGDEPFRLLLNDARFREVPKVLETPKGDDHAAADRRNLGRLRGLRATESRDTRPAPTS